MLAAKIIGVRTKPIPAKADWIADVYRDVSSQRIFQLDSITINEHLHQQIAKHITSHN